MKLRQAIKNIENDFINPVYLLKGNDYFLQNLFLKTLSLRYFKDDIVRKMLLLPDEMTGKEIVDSITKTDLFSKKTIYILREPQKLKGKYSSDLLELCRDPMEGQIVVLIHDEWIKKSSFFTKIENAVDVIDVQTPFANDLKKWVSYLFNQRGKKIDHNCKRLLVDLAGDSLWHLDNEIEKLCLLVGKRDNIRIDDIKSFSGWGRDKYRWEFLLSLGEKKYSKTIELGKNLLMKNETMASLIFPLTQFFQEILFIKMNKGTFLENRGYIPIAPSIRKRLPDYSKRFTINEISLALKLLGSIDRRQKTAYSQDETELTQFIGSIIG